MRLIADLLSLQDPAEPHTALTRAVVTLVIVAVSLVYAGFFGLLAAVAVYLVGVELMSISISWVLLPVGISLVVGLASGLRSILDYWRNYGHG